MFTRRIKPNISVKVRIEEEDKFAMSTSEITSYEDLYDQLLWVYRNQGKVIINKITKSELELTTVGTLEYDSISNKVNDITEIIENYVKGKAIKMKAYGVFSDDKLIQVYTDLVMARFEEQNLKRNGSNNVEIREIFIK